MQVIVVGFGRVGSRTARVLDDEGHDVTVIDSDGEAAQLAETRGFDAIHGEGNDPAVLHTANIEATDAVGALTGDPNVNFETCEAARDAGCRTVMRVDEDFRQDVYEAYAETVDELIYPEQLGAVGAKTALLGGNFNAVDELTENLQLVTVSLDPDAPVVGSRVNGLDIDGVRVYAHGRGDEPMRIPLPGTTLEAGDRLATLVETDRIDDVRTALLGA